MKYDLSSIIQNLEEKKTEKNCFENEKMNLEYSTEKLKHKIKELKRERSQINQSLFSNYSSRKLKESELNNQRNIIAESLNYESLNEAIKRKKNQEEKFTYEIKELKKEIKNLETKILEIKEAIRDKHYEIQDIKFNIDEIKDSIQEIKTEYQIEIEKNKKEIRNKNDLVEKYLQEIDKKNLRIDYLKTKVYHLYSYGITKNNIKNKLISIHNKKSEIQKQLLEYQNNLENKSFEANNEFERQAKNYRIKLFNQFINEHLREYNNIINENKDFVDMNQNKKIYQLDLELKDDAVRSKYRYIYPDIHIDLPWPNYFYTIEEKKDYDLQKEFFEPLEIYKDKFIESKIQDYLNKFQKLEEQLDNLGALEDKLKMDLDTAIKNFNNEEKKKNEDENSIKENKYEIENIREKIIKLEMDINSIYFDIGDIENEKKQEIQKANDEILCKKKEIKKILDVIEYNTNSMHLFNNDNFKKNDELTKIEKKKQDLNSELKHLIETKNKIDSLEKEIFDIENEDFFLNDEKDRLSGQIKINEKLIRANIEKLNRIKIPKYLINEINYLEKKVDKINKKINNQKNCKQSLLNKKKIRTNTLSINEREKNNLINNLNNFEKDNRSYYLLQKQIENISYHIKEKNKEIDLIRDKQIEFIETKKREIEEIEKRVSELERSKDGFKEEIDRREHFYKKIYEEYEEEKKKLKNIQNNIQKIQEYIKIKEKDIKKINEDIDGYQKQINQNLKEIDNYEKNIKEEKKKLKIQKKELLESLNKEIKQIEENSLKRIKQIDFLKNKIQKIKNKNKELKKYITELEKKLIYKFINKIFNNQKNIKTQLLELVEKKKIYENIKKLFFYVLDKREKIIELKKSFKILNDYNTQKEVLEKIFEILEIPQNKIQKKTQDSGNKKQNINKDIKDSWIVKTQKQVIKDIFINKENLSDEKIINYIKSHSDKTQIVESGKLEKYFQEMKSFLKEGKSSLIGSSMHTWKETDIKKWILEYKSKLQKYKNEHKKSVLSEKEIHKNIISKKEILAVIIRAVELKKLKNNHKIRNTQLISLLSMINPDKNHGSLYQIQTGEGKTLISAMLAAYKSLHGKKVDILTSTKLLAEEAYKKCYEFYSLLGLKSNFLNDNIDDIEKKGIYTSDILYGDPLIFAGDKIDEISKDQNYRSKRKHEFLIIDEVDNILVENISSKVIHTKKIPGMDHLNIIFARIYKKLEDLSKHIILRENDFWYIGEEFKIDKNGKIKPLDAKIIDITSKNPKCQKIPKNKIETFLEEVIVRDVAQSLKNLTLKERKEYIAIRKKVSDLHNKLFKILKIKRQLIIEQENETCKLTIEKLKKNIENIESEERLIKTTIENIFNKKENFQLQIIEIPNFLRGYVKKELKKWVKNALYIKSKYCQNKKNYIAQKDAIKIITQNTGQVEENMIYGDGVNISLQIKHNIKINQESITTAYMSYLKYIKLYKNNIIGMTGTLGSKYYRNYYKKLLKVKCIEIPKYIQQNIKGKKAIQKGLQLKSIITHSEKIWLDTICKKIIEKTERGRATLIITENIQKLELIQQTLLKKYKFKTINLFTYTGIKKDAKMKKGENNLKNNYDLTNQTLKPGQILLSTNILGRGADIKLEKAIEETGGLHVVITFVSNNQRIDRQNEGRTARRDQKGTYRYIIYTKNKKDKALSDIIVKRDILDEKNLQNKKQTIREILQKDAIFTKYLNFRNLRYKDKDNIYKNSVDEIWGKWLKNNDNIINNFINQEDEKEIEKNLNTLFNTIDEDEKENRIVKNPYYILDYGNKCLDYNVEEQQIEKSGTLEKVVKWFLGKKISKKEDFVKAYNNYKKAIALDPENYIYLPRYYNAYASLKYYPLDSSKKEKSIEYLQQTIDIIEKIYLEQINDLYMNVLKKENLFLVDEKEEISSNLFNQCQNNYNLLSTIKKSAENTISEIQKSKGDNTRIFMELLTPEKVLEGDYDKYEDEVKALKLNGFVGFISAKAADPLDWGSIITAFIASCFLFVVGLALAFCPVPFISCFGESLMIDSVLDILQFGVNIYRGEFNFDDWVNNKLISLTICGVASVIKLRHGFKQAKEIRNFLGILETVGKNTLKLETMKLLYKSSGNVLKELFNKEEKVKQEIKKLVSRRIKQNSTIQKAIKIDNYNKNNYYQNEIAKLNQELGIEYNKFFDNTATAKQFLNTLGNEFTKYFSKFTNILDSSVNFYYYNKLGEKYINDFINRFVEKFENNILNQYDRIDTKENDKNLDSKKESKNKKEKLFIEEVLENLENKYTRDDKKYILEKYNHNTINEKHENIPVFWEKTKNDEYSTGGNELTERMKANLMIETSEKNIVNILSSAISGISLNCFKTGLEVANKETINSTLDAYEYIKNKNFEPDLSKNENNNDKSKKSERKKSTKNYAKTQKEADTKNTEKPKKTSFDKAKKKKQDAGKNDKEENIKTENKKEAKNENISKKAEKSKSEKRSNKSESSEAKIEDKSKETKPNKAKSDIKNKEVKKEFKKERKTEETKNYENTESKVSTKKQVKEESLYDEIEKEIKKNKEKFETSWWKTDEKYISPEEWIKIWLKINKKNNEKKNENNINHEKGETESYIKKTKPNKAKSDVKEKEVKKELKKDRKAEETKNSIKKENKENKKEKNKKETKNKEEDKVKNLWKKTNSKTTKKNDTSKPDKKRDEKVEKKNYKEVRKYRGYYKNKSFRTFKDFSHDKYYNNPVEDKCSKVGIPTLHPIWREDVKAMVNEVYYKYGIILRIKSSDAYRTIAQQKAIFNNPKCLIKASPYNSLHVRGLAFDCYLVTKKGQLLKRNLEKFEQTVVKIAKKYGIYWGGNFKNRDYPHFEKRIDKFKIKEGYDYKGYLNYLKKKEKNGEYDEKYLVLD